MIYLSGCAARSRLPGMQAAGIGLMLTPDAGYGPEWASAVSHWAADNGCYSAGDRFDFGYWLAWLERLSVVRSHCLFAVVPDVVGDAAATLQRWEAMAHRVRPLGYPLAFVLQDGQEVLPLPWSDCHAVFVGGSTEWKLSRHAAALVREATRRGKWRHMGRVNSGRRLRYAAQIGCQSADGTYMAFNPSESIQRMGRWLTNANAPQLGLWPREEGT